MLEKGSIIQESVSPWSSVFGQKLVLLSFANLKRSLKWKAFQFRCRCSRFFSRYKYIFDVGPQNWVGALGWSILSAKCGSECYCKSFSR